MSNKEVHTIYSIGHSTHPIAVFLEMLSAFSIEILADVRRYPGSAKYPQYNKENLTGSLAAHGIQYLHLEDLGGRRKVNKNSHNTRWRKDSFRGYADYMETVPFKNAMTILEQIALKQKTAYMCSEAVWWRCHRSMISDYLKAEGWEVLHIMSAAKLQAHPYTAAAKIIDGNLIYTD